MKNYYYPEGLRNEINESGDVSRFIFDRVNVITELDKTRSPIDALDIFKLR